MPYQYFKRQPRKKERQTEGEREETIYYYKKNK